MDGACELIKFTDNNTYVFKYRTKCTQGLVDVCTLVLGVGDVCIGVITEMKVQIICNL